jgi:hypothetical protein
VKKVAIFALASLALIALVAWLMTFAFPSSGERHAIAVSAVIAYVAQLVAFGVVRAYRTTNVFAGWGLGMLVRFGVLAVYALIGVKALQLPLSAALLSLVTFFFVSTLLEPVLLS